MSGDTENGRYDLTGQVAFVTGGGRGLGRAFAQALANAGAAVAITARTESQLHETLHLIDGEGGTALAFPADVTDQPAMKQVVAEVESQLGPVDILINNAAVITPLGYDWEADPDEWWRTLEINLRAPFLCTRLVLPGMLARHHGRIVNVSSIAACEPLPFATAYSISKTALSQMTRLLAAAVKQYGISAFALAPFGPTAMIETVATSPKVSEAISTLFAGLLEQGSDEIEQSAQMLLFLLSGQADALTGRHISIDDSIDDLQRRSVEIVQNDLYTLRRCV
jgi:NAD(P)-dependent dehydrogenase (short-subunit alcohol dehydrogenase family)